MFKHQDQNFITFIGELEKLLSSQDENTLKFQEKQVNGLTKLERQFRRQLVRHPRGLDAYKAFIDRTHNILTARPYFRERDTTFKAYISSALKTKDAVALTRFNINYQFVQFVLKLGWWTDKSGEKLVATAKKIEKLRNDLIVCNLPLAISTARTFYSRNSQSHLTYLDFCQIASTGLAEGCDKFSGVYARNFRSVCIGRMVGNLIEENSNTYVHLYPSDRKLLYRIRKLLRKIPVDGAVNFDDIHAQLNEIEAVAEDKKRTNMEDMINVLTASTLTLASSMPKEGDEEQLGVIDTFADDEMGRPDFRLEKSETWREARSAIITLPLVEQKLLAMKAMSFD